MHGSSRGHRRAAGLLCATLVATLGMGVSPGIVQAGTPTTTTLEVEPAAPETGWRTCLHASVSQPGGYPVIGNVHFYDDSSGTPVEINLGWIPPGAYTSDAWYCVDEGFSVGQHAFYAAYVGTYWGFDDSTSETVVVQVDTFTSVVRMSAPETIEANHPFEISASVGIGYVRDPSGTIAVWQVGGAAPLCSATADTSVTCSISGLAAGSYAYYATWSGDDRTKPATSDPVSVSVTADVVHASNVGLQWSKFYPYKDGYRDTVGVHGTRDEPVSVLIRVYNPGGGVVRTATIGLGTGGYNYAWNGRRSDGTILPEGKYRVVQKLTDGAGTIASVTSYVTLSKKRLIWHSSSITKKGSSVSASGHDGAGSIAINTTDGSVRLRAPSMWSDWAGAGWQFSMPTGVAYKGVKFKVYAKHKMLMAPTRIGAQSYNLCGYSSGQWYESCFAAFKDIGNGLGTVAWYATDGLGSAYRAGTKVRGMLSSYGGTTWVYKARLVFKYATLGY